MQDNTPQMRPSNIESEQAILGALLLNNSAIEKIGHLGAHHFYEPAHSRIFAAILERIEAGALASPVTLKPFFASDPGLPDLGGLEYISRLAGATISIRAVPDYAKMIIDLAARRGLIEGLEEAMASVASFESMDRAAERLDEALMLARTDTQERPATITFAQAAGRAADLMNTAYQRGTGLDIPTHIDELDKVMGGFSNDELILLGGRPSMGKSAIAIEIMRRQARAGLWSVYWSSEMSEESVALRMISTEGHGAGGQSFHKAGRGIMSEDEFRAMLTTARDMEGLPIRIIDSGIRKLPRILREIRRAVRRIKDSGGKIGCVIVDYLQQIDPSSKAGRFEAITEISMSIKALQMELRVPFLALSQLSRKVEERNNKRPMLSDLRESGQLEQDANKVIFCYRDEYYLERLMAGADGELAGKTQSALDACRGVLELIVAKQRTGPITTVSVGYDAAHNRLYSLDHKWDAPADDQEEIPF